MGGGTDKKKKRKRGTKKRPPPRRVSRANIHIVYLTHAIYTPTCTCVYEVERVSSIELTGNNISPPCWRIVYRPGIELPCSSTSFIKLNNRRLRSPPSPADHPRLPVFGCPLRDFEAKFLSRTRRSNFAFAPVFLPSCDGLLAHTRGNIRHTANLSSGDDEKVRFPAIYTMPSCYKMKKILEGTALLLYIYIYIYTIYIAGRYRIRRTGR